MILIRVDDRVSVLTSGILKACVEGDPEYKRKCREYFSESMIEWGCEALPKIYRIDRKGILISDCVDGDYTICPCDKAHNASIKRSETNGIGFPAFPHHWPICKVNYSINPLKKTTIPTVGFCGRDRPDKRFELLRVFEESQLVETDIIRRRKFLGRELSNGARRRDYLKNLTENQYQLVSRGVGNYSYRLYETMAAGRIPLMLFTGNSPSAECWEKIIPSSSDPEDLLKLITRFHSNLEENLFIKWQEQIRKFWIKNLSPVGWWIQNRSIFESS